MYYYIEYTYLSVVVKWCRGPSHIRQYILLQLAASICVNYGAYLVLYSAFSCRHLVVNHS